MKEAAVSEEKAMQEAKFLDEDSAWNDKIIDMEAQNEKQKAENEKNIQARRDQYAALHAKAPEQEQKAAEESKDLDEKIKNSKRMSDALQAKEQKTAKQMKDLDERMKDCKRRSDANDALLAKIAE